MSFLTRTSRAARFVVARPQQICAVRPFSASRVAALKESDIHTADGAESEKHKQDQLQKQKDGKGHWKPELASNSEEAIAADRHEHDDHTEGGLKDLQEKTKNHPEEKHK